MNPGDATTLSASLSPSDWQAVGVTLRLAATTTLILLLLGTPLAWWLAHARGRAASAVDALVALPLVLPPTVLGFYLLVLMGPRGPLGEALAAVHLPPLVFSFSGLVLASVISSLPFMVQPLRDAFSAIPPRVLDAAATLRARPLDRFFSVVVPLSRRGFLSALTLTFAHTVGEFGVVLMVGGNIPGATRVLSIAIYDHTEAMNHGAAHVLAGALLLASFLALLALNLANRRRAVAVAP
jgi:molybdate transport system permease protein